MEKSEILKRISSITNTLEMIGGKIQDESINHADQLCSLGGCLSRLRILCEEIEK